MTEEPAIDGWAMVEMLGHRRVAGRITEVQVAGAGFLRIDVPATNEHAAQTMLIAPGSVYALHPVAEDVATAFAARFRTPPIHRYEIAPDPYDPVRDSGALDQDEDDPEEPF